MKNIIIGIIIGGIVFTLGGVVASTMISSKNVTYQNKTVNTALDELYDNAVTGKELVAAAITNKGVSTASTDTYEVMANNINNIDIDNSEINQKINNLESKHNSDIASLTGSISSLNQSLTNTIIFGLINGGGSLKANVNKELALLLVPSIMIAYVNYNGKYYTAVSITNTIGEFIVDNIKIHYTINAKTINLTSNVDCTLKGMYALTNLSDYS